jgi:hypothetical protein
MRHAVPKLRFDFQRAARRYNPTAAARLRAQVTSYVICGGQSGTGVGLLRVLRLPPFCSGTRYMFICSNRIVLNKMIDTQVLCSIHVLSEASRFYTCLNGSERKTRNCYAVVAVSEDPTASVFRVEK